MSDTQTNLATALLSAMRAMGPVRKDAKNPAFRSTYATLQSILDTIEGPLWDNGLIVVQRFTVDTDPAPILVTDLIHAASNERLSSAVRVVGKDPTDPQKVGGAITYMRRYALLALLGLAPADDDDGDAASKPAPRATSAPHSQGNATTRASAPQAAQNGVQTPAADGDLTANLLGRIRDDTAQPEFRRRALHTYFSQAETLGELEARRTIVLGSGLPSEDMAKGYAYHAKRFAAAPDAGVAG